MFRDLRCRVFLFYELLSNRGLFMMKVYYFSEPLQGWVSFFGYINKEARHAGLIVDAPDVGLMRIEIGTNMFLTMELKVTRIAEFHRQYGSSPNGMWLYEGGETKLTLGQILSISRSWVDDNPRYDVFGENCRNFTSTIAEVALTGGNGHLYSGISGCGISATKVSEIGFCRTVEQKIRHNKFNTGEYIKSTVAVLSASTFAHGGVGVADSYVAPGELSLSGLRVIFAYQLIHDWRKRSKLEKSLRSDKHMYEDVHLAAAAMDGLSDLFFQYVSETDPVKKGLLRQEFLEQEQSVQNLLWSKKNDTSFRRREFGGKVSNGKVAAALEDIKAINARGHELGMWYFINQLNNLEDVDAIRDSIASGKEVDLALFDKYKTSLGYSTVDVPVMAQDEIGEFSIPTDVMTTEERYPFYSGVRSIRNFLSTLPQAQKALILELLDGRKWGILSAQYQRAQESNDWSLMGRAVREFLKFDPDNESFKLMDVQVNDGTRHYISSLSEADLNSLKSEDYPSFVKLINQRKDHFVLKRVNVCIEKNDFSGAEEEAKHLIDLDTKTKCMATIGVDRVNFLCFLAHQQLLSAATPEDFDRIGVDLTGLLKIDPHHMGAIKDLASCYARIGKFKELIDLMDAYVLKDNPDDSYGLTMTAQAQIALDNVAIGRATLEVVLRKDPHYSLARKSLINSYTQQLGALHADYVKVRNDLGVAADRSHRLLLPDAVAKLVEYRAWLRAHLDSFKALSDERNKHQDFLSKEPVADKAKTGSEGVAKDEGITEKFAVDHIADNEALFDRLSIDILTIPAEIFRFWAETGQLALHLAPLLLKGVGRLKLLQMPDFIRQKAWLSKLLQGLAYVHTGLDYTVDLIKPSALTLLQIYAHMKTFEIKTLMGELSTLVRACERVHMFLLLSQLVSGAMKAVGTASRSAPVSDFLNTRVFPVLKSSLTRLTNDRVYHMVQMFVDDLSRIPALVDNYTIPALQLGSAVGNVINASSSGFFDRFSMFPPEVFIYIPEIRSYLLEPNPKDDQALWRFFVGRVLIRLAEKELFGQIVLGAGFALSFSKVISIWVERGMGQNIGFVFEAINPYFPYLKFTEFFGVVMQTFFCLERDWSAYCASYRFQKALAIYNQACQLHRDGHNDLAIKMFKQVCSDLAVKTVLAPEGRSLSVDAYVNYNRLAGTLLIDRVLGDGNCLFASVASYTGYGPEDLRQLAMDYIQTHRSEMQAFIPGDFDEYVRQMNADHAWDDERFGEPQLRALEQVLGRPIMVLNSAFRPSWELKGAPIYIQYNGVDHFDAVVLPSDPALREKCQRIREAADRARNASAEKLARSREVNAQLVAALPGEVRDCLALAREEYLASVRVPGADTHALAPVGLAQVRSEAALVAVKNRELWAQLRAKMQGTDAFVFASGDAGASRSASVPAAGL